MFVEPQLNTSKPEPGHPEKPESPWKHVLSFVWMILFTAIAFWVVGEQKLGAKATFWVILLLAVLQVFLQLFTFMHLNQKRYGIVVIFIFIGIFFATIISVGIVLM
jgi:cytochrome c oxidase subunit 4